MTTPLSLIYAALCNGAFGGITNTPQGPGMRVTPQLLSQVLGDENTPALDDSVIAPLVAVYINNQLTRAQAQATAASAQVTAVTALQTTLQASTAISAQAASPAPNPTPTP